MCFNYTIFKEGFMSKKILFVIFILSAFSAFAQDMQTTPTPQPAPPSLATILDEAAKQTENYRETFRDLLATETKTFEKYEKNGDLDDQTKVESNFFVYQSSKDGKTSSELRNVIKVDDELVPDSQARADRFLAELQKTKTIEKELEKIQDESLRYDKNFVISGLTLYEALPLAENMRPYFEFNLTGTENYRGRDAYLVSYRQTRKSPFITIDEKSSKEPGLKADFDLNLPGALKRKKNFCRENYGSTRRPFRFSVKNETSLCKPRRRSLCRKPFLNMSRANTRFSFQEK